MDIKKQMLYIGIMSFQKNMAIFLKKKSIGSITTLQFCPKMLLIFFFAPIKVNSLPNQKIIICRKTSPGADTDIFH